MANELGEYIRLARDRRGWSLRHAAQQIGISHARLWELEMGRSNKGDRPIVPTQRNLEKIAAAYDLPIDHLFALAHFPRYTRLADKLTPEELGLLDVYRQLAPGKRQLVLTLVQGLRDLPPEPARPPT